MRAFFVPAMFNRKKNCIKKSTDCQSKILPFHIKIRKDFDLSLTAK